jgi:transposase
MKMTKAKRARYTLEFKQEAVRLVESGQTIAAAARSVGMVEQTLFKETLIKLSAFHRSLS